MRTKLVILCAALFLAVGAALGAAGGSHPDSRDNGKDSPRFYASPPGHPTHP